MHGCFKKIYKLKLENNTQVFSTNPCFLKKMVYVSRDTLNFMAPFYGWGSTASRLEPLRGGSLLFTTKFPEIFGAHFTDLGRMKGWVDLGAT